MNLKVDERAYETREQFRQDIIQIRINAELYNPRDKDVRKPLEAPSKGFGVPFVIMTTLPPGGLALTSLSLGLCPQDHRGKAIVSAACNMLDHVDSMFHNFKRSIGYDLFKRYDLGLLHPSPVPVPPVLPQSDGMSYSRLDKAYASAQRQEDDKAGGPNRQANGASGAMVREAPAPDPTHLSPLFT